MAGIRIPAHRLDAQPPAIKAKLFKNLGAILADRLRVSYRFRSRPIPLCPPLSPSMRNNLPVPAGHADRRRAVHLPKGPTEPKALAANHHRIAEVARP